MAQEKAGSWDAMRDVFAWITESALPATPRHVALVIAKHMGSTGVCGLSTGTIAEETGLGPTAVQSAIRLLSYDPEKVSHDPEKVFSRTQGGARTGDRYSSSTWSLLKHVKGYGTREARLARGSLNGVEGSVKRCRGVRQAVTKDQRITTSRPDTLSRTREDPEEAGALLRAYGKPLDAIPCPSCGVAGHLMQSPGRGGHPPGWWCKPPGCKFNFALGDPEIIEQLTPGARRRVEETLKTMTVVKPDRPASKQSRAVLADAAIDEGFRQVEDEGVFLVKSRPEVANAKG